MISTMHCFLQWLSLPWIGLQISQVSVAVDNNIPKEKSAFLVFLEERVAFIFCFRASIVLRSNRAILIAPVDSTRANILKPKLLHSFCFLDHFIIIGVCSGISYHDFIGQTPWSGLWAKAQKIRRSRDSKWKLDMLKHI